MTRHGPATEHATTVPDGIALMAAMSNDNRTRDPREDPMSTTEQTPRLVLSELTLDAIQAEATNAHLKHGEHSMLGPKTNDRRLAILTEEVGEVARELNDAEIDGRPVDRDKLVKELIQAGAMCASWVQALEGGEAGDD